MTTKICILGHRFEKTSDCPSCPICNTQDIKSAYANGFPKIGAPAFNALRNKGITLSDIPNYSEQELLVIHGIGPKALSILSQYLKEKGLAFNKK
jgi:hypothetical protein